MKPHVIFLMQRGVFAGTDWQDIGRTPILQVETNRGHHYHGNLSHVIHTSLVARNDKTNNLGCPMSATSELINSVLSLTTLQNYIFISCTWWYGRHYWQYWGGGVSSAVSRTCEARGKSITRYWGGSPREISCVNYQISRIQPKENVILNVILYWTGIDQ
jgi:hypothetical protein